VVLGVLAPNRKGIERALAADADEICVFLSVSESHNQKNLNRSVERSLQDVREAAELVKGSGVRLKGAIATAFGCPFEGDVSLDAVERMFPPKPLCRRQYCAHGLVTSRRCDLRMRATN